MDILNEIMTIFPYNRDIIETVESGERYLAVMNNEGNIGVCAVLGNDTSNVNIENPDLKSIPDRIFLTAYYNSLLNIKQQNYGSGDIAEIIDFHDYRNIVMIGYFYPIVERLKNKNVEVSVFDFRDLEVSLPLEKQKEYLQKADCVILTATSIFNKTFNEIIENTSGDVFILGPSSILNEYFFKFQNVKAIFGSIFEPYDNKVIDAVKDGLGTRKFLKYGKKVVLRRE